MASPTRHRALLDEAYRAFRARDYNAVVRVGVEAVGSARAEFGTAGGEFREALHLLAVGYHGTGFIVVARALFEWLARTGDAASTLTTRTELAHCMMMEDDREQGLALLDDLLPELLAGPPVLLAEALNGIGNTLIESGQPGDALPLYQFVEQVRRGAGDSYKIAECLYNLGSCYHALKDDVPAVECLSEALDRFRANLGEAHPYVAEAGFRLGVSCHRLADYLKAAVAYRTVVRCGKLASAAVFPGHFGGRIRAGRRRLPARAPPPGRRPFVFTPLRSYSLGGRPGARRSVRHHVPGSGAGSVQRYAPSAAATTPVVMANPDYELALAAATGGPDRPALASLRHLIFSRLENSTVDSSSDRPGVATAFYFPPLPGAAEEGALVAALLGTVALTGADAVKTRLTALTSPRILHLATHGYYIPIRRAPGPVAEVIEAVSVQGEGTFLVKAVPSYFR